MVDESQTFSSFRERLYHLQVNLFVLWWFIALVINFLIVLWVHLYCSRKPKMNGCASVDLAYMDGAFLHEEIFKKEKWYDYYTQI